MPKIDVKTAVRVALAYLKDLGDLMPARDVRLEETEYDDDGFWLITLSTVEDSPELTTGLDELLSRPTPRQRYYRIFRIDGGTGEVKSMKVRTLQPIE